MCFANCSVGVGRVHRSFERRRSGGAGSGGGRIEAEALYRRRQGLLWRQPDRSAIPECHGGCGTVGERRGRSGTDRFHSGASRNLCVAKSTQWHFHALGTATHGDAIRGVDVARLAGCRRGGGAGVYDWQL